MARIARRTARNQGRNPEPGNAARRRLRAVTAGAALVLGVLPLTACSDDDGGGTLALSPASSSSPTGSPTPSSSPSSSKTSDAKSQPSASDQEQASPPRKTTTETEPAADKEPVKPVVSRVTCTSAKLKTVAQPVSRPINHLLITVKNTGTKACDLYAYPRLRFGEAQSLPMVFEDSMPQSVPLLSPGESAYAGVALSSAEGGSGGYSTTSLDVGFVDRQSRSVGTDKPSLPSAGVYVDASLKVTYWQDELDDALTW